MVPGRIPLLTFYVDKLKVDITINKTSDITKTEFVKEGMRRLDDKGCQARNAILLAKALCMNNGILGSKEGKLPS